MSKSLAAGLIFCVCGLLGGGEQSSDIPRDRTLIMDCGDFLSCSGQIKDHAAFNPFLPGAASRTGWDYLYEPLYFYNAYGQGDELIPWIVEGHEFNADYTEVTIRIRPGVEWSDGVAWTAADLVFTIDMLKANAPELKVSTDMQAWVKQATVVDTLTAHIVLTAPNPRFIFTYFTNTFDNGVFIVPKHIWEGKDPTTFANYDLARGWPVVSGPYSIKYSGPQQRILDLRQGW